MELNAENTKNLTESLVLCMKDVSQKSVKSLSESLSEITDKTLEVSLGTAEKLKKIGEILSKME